MPVERGPYTPRRAAAQAESHGRGLNNPVLAFFRGPFIRIMVGMLVVLQFVQNCLGHKLLCRFSTQVRNFAQPWHPPLGSGLKRRLEFFRMVKTAGGYIDFRGSVGKA